MILVYLVVVFFGADPIGVLLPKEYPTREACLAVALPIAHVSTKENPAVATCVAKEKKETT